MSQNAVQTPTTGTVSGLQNNQDINAALLAILSFLSGASAPTAAGLSAAGSSVSSLAGFPWHDTTMNLLKVRDQADSTWIIQGLLDETNKLWAPAFRGFLAGFTLSNDGTTPNTKIDASAGMCVDDTNTYPMSLAAGSVDFTIVGANGLDAGAIAASTWYHIFAIGGSGKTPALLASTSISAPTYPSGYTYKRRLGSVKTDASSHLLAFSQNGDQFLWSVPFQDVNVSTLGATPTLYTLSTPPGVETEALLRINANNATNTTAVLVTSPDVASSAAGTPNGNWTLNVISATTGNVGEIRRRTNASSQVRAVSTNASTQFGILTYGWLDTRGRLV